MALVYQESVRLIANTWSDSMNKQICICSIDYFSFFIKVFLSVHRDTIRQTLSISNRSGRTKKVCRMVTRKYKEYFSIKEDRSKTGV